MSGAVLIEGYAALFGQSDLGGDVVRGGAFARSLRTAADVPMLLQHRNGAIAGKWHRIREDGRGLYVRGLVSSASALALIERGLEGLSIGFRPVTWRDRTSGGRDLIAVDLVEVSLVADPMQPLARLKRLPEQRLAA